MPKQAFSSEVQSVLDAYLHSAKKPSHKVVQVDGVPTSVDYPYPSPADWRDCWIYFLLIDRFNNPKAPPKFQWNEKYGFRQGGTFNGVKERLPYLQNLGVKAIWLSPVVKNTRPETEGFAYAYPGYNAQDFLHLEGRYASDGSEATAEVELGALVQEAHARGIYVVIDIVLNHAGRVFDYLRDGQMEATFIDRELLYDPTGKELGIAWMNGLGSPRPDWENTSNPAGAGNDDAIWPQELQRPFFFRRRGSKVSDSPEPPLNYVPGDFSLLRQLAVEYDASVPGQESLRDRFGVSPVLSILIRAYQYLIAKYDIDGFRIDTVKYIRPDIIASFGNAMREFALSAGKKNFFTFGEIYDNDGTIDRFVGRNSGQEGFGIDSALDYPLFFALPPAIKSLGPNPPGVEAVSTVFSRRKLTEQSHISSHGEAGKYFVSFLDNHDQNSRFNTPGTPETQITMAMALLFCLQGIPCIYYGTEQGLQGTTNGLDSMESVREALWGKQPSFDTSSVLYKELSKIAAVRMGEATLRYGRLYFREISGNGTDYGPSAGAGGLIAFSRILSNREIVVVANTSGARSFSGAVMVDIDIARRAVTYNVAYSNKGTRKASSTTIVDGTIHPAATHTRLASLPISLSAWEVQVLIPTV